MYGWFYNEIDLILRQFCDIVPSVISFGALLHWSPTNRSWHTCLKKKRHWAATVGFGLRSSCSSCDGQYDLQWLRATMSLSHHQIAKNYKVVVWLLSAFAEKGRLWPELTLINLYLYGRINKQMNNTHISQQTCNTASVVL